MWLAASASPAWAAPLAHGPTGSPGAWFSPDAYPPAALRKGAQGRTVATLAINDEGRVTGCTVQASSGDSDLDAATCRIALDRGQFQPATDAQGIPIASSYRLPVRWVLPDEQPPAGGSETTDPAATAPHKGSWLSRLAEAHHLWGFFAVVIAFVTSRLRRVLGWSSLDATGREMPDDRYVIPTRWHRLRSGAFGRINRPLSVVAPIVLLAIALAWLGW